MAQNKTTLLLNNLVVLNYPLKTSNQIQVSPLAPQEDPQPNMQQILAAQQQLSASMQPAAPDGSNVSTPPPAAPQPTNDTQLKQVIVQLPFLALLQKIDFTVSEAYQANTPAILSVHRQQIAYPTAQDQQYESDNESWQDVIDFKKQKINWRFKSRMRSNSNEFIDGFPLNSQQSQKLNNRQNQLQIEQQQRLQQVKESSAQQKKQLSGFESFSFEASDMPLMDDDDWDTEEIKGTLVCACCSTFKILIQGNFSELQMDDFSLQVSVWPTIRMPTGGATIPLINTSFLLATRQHLEESHEIDFMVAQSLVNARKFIQAAEKFRGIESRLLQQGSRDSLYRAMLLEIIIGESMSQHSQVSEKIYAFKRATLIQTWLDMNIEDVQLLVAALKQNVKRHVKQEEAPLQLFKIKQTLVRILIANVQSHIEVIRMAVLKTLEYLLDALNCSLENQIVDILSVVCSCYPSSAQTQQQQQQQQQRESEVPKLMQLKSFFQHQFPQAQPGGIHQYQQNQQAQNSFSFFSWYSIHNELHCQVQDVKTLSHSYVQSALNCYNHILENMGILLASASHYLLVQVFKQIILPQSQNGKLAPELKIYLLKYANQITQICKGDISFPGAFLSDLIDVLVEQPLQQQGVPTTKQRQVEGNSGSSKRGRGMRVQSAATQAVSPHFSNLQQVCLELLETMKLHYFPNIICVVSQNNANQQPSQKGLKTFEWVVQNLSQQAAQLERISTQSQQRHYQTVQEHMRMNILISIVESVVQSILPIASESLSKSKANLQGIYCRQSKGSESSILDAESESHKETKTPQQLMSQNLKYLQMLLPLTAPLISLFTFSTQSQDRLPLFKQVWHLLVRILQRLPPKLTKKPNLTLPALVQPHLERLTTFMQTSSPSKHMLEFLQIVITTECQTMPLDFCQSKLLPTLLGTIPHNLHDEIFQVTATMLDIFGDNLKPQNMKLLVEVLVHKYTMRSKEHKFLVQKVLQTVLSSQNEKIFDCFLQETLIENSWLSANDEVFFEKLAMLQECVAQMNQQHVWHFRRMLNRSNQAFEKVFKINHRSKLLMVKLLLNLTEFYIKVCAPFNHYEYPILSSLRADELIAQNVRGDVPPQANGQTRTANQSAQRVPFINTVQVQNIQNRGNMVYSEPSVELFSIGHHEEDLYFSGGLDQPRVEMDPQVAAYLEMEPNNRQRTQHHYQSQHVDYRPQILLNNNNHPSRSRGEDDDQRVDLAAEDDNNPMLMRQQSELLYESPRGAQSILCDQVNLIDRDRLLLIQIHSILIRQVVEAPQPASMPGDVQQQQQPSQQPQQPGLTAFQHHVQDTQETSLRNNDANVKLSVLNLMQNLFTNLLPTPTLKNMAVQDIIGQERVNLVQPVRMQQVPEAAVPSEEASSCEDDERDESQTIEQSSQIIPPQPGQQVAFPAPTEQQQPLDESQQQQPQLQQQNQAPHMEMIPDFSEIKIAGVSWSPKSQNAANQSKEAATFAEEFECSDAKYLCARVLAFLKISKYLEEIILTTSWANLKSLAICVLNQGVVMPNVSILPSKLQRHLKNALQPLIIKLIQNSKDSESRAAALNTLASICNLQLKLRRNFFTSANGDSNYQLELHQQLLQQFDDEEPNKQGHRLLQLHNSGLQLDDQISDDIRMSKHLDLFRVNSAFVSVAIWQEVFDLQDDQTQQIREASSALVRLCAPRDSVTHFLRIKREQYKLKLNQILSSQQFTVQNTAPSQVTAPSQLVDSQTTSGQTTGGFTAQAMTIQSNQYLQAPGVQGAQGAEMSESEQSSSHSSQNSDFYEQQPILEQETRSILSLFNLKCAPSLALQADRQGPDHMSSAKRQQFKPVGQGFMDLYEDGFLIDGAGSRGINNSNFYNHGSSSSLFKKANYTLVSDSNDEEDDSQDGLHSESSNDEVYIFRRDNSARRMPSDSQNNDKDNKTNVVFSSKPSEATLIQVLQQETNEDLGIIDLDDSELFDDFEELDDDKLPVLKNTYSKKNRPNNSKSVAIGSRSQGGTLKQLGLRGIIASPSHENNKAQSTINLLDSDSDPSDRQQIVSFDSAKQRQQQLKLVAAAIGMDRIEELKSDYDEHIMQKQQKNAVAREVSELSELEYELSMRGGLSVASLPVANRRQIQSAGGKRNNNKASTNSSRRSSYKNQNARRDEQQHVLSQSETLVLPNDLKNLDIEEVQIFVKRKQRPVSGRGSIHSQNERLIRSLGSQYFMTETLDQLSSQKTNKLIQTDMIEEQKNEPESCQNQQQLQEQPSANQSAAQVQQTQIAVAVAASGNSMQKQLSKKGPKDKNVVRVIQKVSRAETTPQPQHLAQTQQATQPQSKLKQNIVTRQGSKKPAPNLSATKMFETQNSSATEFQKQVSSSANKQTTKQSQTSTPHHAASSSLKHVQESADNQPVQQMLFKKTSASLVATAPDKKGITDKRPLGSRRQSPTTQGLLPHAAQAQVQQQDRKTTSLSQLKATQEQLKDNYDEESEKIVITDIL